MKKEIEVKELAKKNFEIIYGNLNYFEEVWPTLKTLEEKTLFAYNCCIAYKRDGSYEHEVYWHCYNINDECWHDYDHDVFQKMLKSKRQRANIEVYNSITGETISLI